MLQKKRHAKCYVRLPMNYGITAGKCALALPVLRPVADELRYHGWKVCVGASGTVQALQEIMMAQGMDERITLEKLQQLKQRAIHCGRLEEL